MSFSEVIVVVVVAVTLWAAFVLTVERAVLPWVAHRCADELNRGVAWLIVHSYSRLVHRVRFACEDAIRQQRHPGPLLIVCNHTAGIDPLLVQSGCHFYVRWLMAEDMMVDSLNPLWRWAEIIAVSRDGRDTTAVRESIRHLRGGGVVGVFPEGGIPSPAGRIAPFMAGVGIIAARTRTPILLAWISGTSATGAAFESIVRPSHARVRYELIDPFPAELSGAEIAERMRERIAELSGWPLTDVLHATAEA